MRTADPTLAVLVDSLIERGAKVAEWTDEEAEHCRLAAFWPMLRDVSKGPWSEASQIAYSGTQLTSGRSWVWHVAIERYAATTIERRVGAFDLPDFALHVSVSAGLAKYMARGKRLPAKFRLRGKPYARVVPQTV